MHLPSFELSRETPAVQAKYALIRNRVDKLRAEANFLVATAQQERLDGAMKDSAKHALGAAKKYNEANLVMATWWLQPR